VPNVVVGITGSPANLAAVQAAGEYARLTGDPLVAVAVGPRLTAETVLGWVGTALPLDRPTVRAVVRRGRVTAALAAATGPGDLLVVGTSRSRLTRWTGRSPAARCRRRGLAVAAVRPSPLVAELRRLVSGTAGA
jgi:hypothetical protein